MGAFLMLVMLVEVVLRLHFVFNLLTSASPEPVMEQLVPTQTRYVLQLSVTMGFVILLLETVTPSL
jgi:hypothetical protein